MTLDPALDPQLAALLTSMASSGAPPLTAGTAVQARGMFEQLAGALQAARPLPKVGEITEDVVGDVRVRVYRPAGGASTGPTVLFVHGGGWVIGGIASHDDQARRICRELSAVVVSVDYRLAPEAPFPGAVDDVWAVYGWLVDNISVLGGDPARIGVAGDSAGGNLCAVTAQLARDHGRPLAAQLLLYPAVDVPGEYASRESNAEGYFLTLADTRWFVQQYLGLAPGAEPDPAVLSDPRLSPLRASSLAGLAPAVVATAQFDPLRDEGDAYAAALRDAGVIVVHQQFAGLVHGFFGLGGLSVAADQASGWAIAQFGALLGG